jgi:hypothetical protein
MEFPTYLIPKLVPRENPPDRYLSPQVVALAQSIEKPILRQSYLWSAALTAAGFASNLPLPARFSGVSAGFVFVNENSRNEISIANDTEGFVFGISIMISSDSEQAQEVYPLRVGNRIFPLVINYGRTQMHGLPSHPALGSGACWVKSAQNSSWDKGILTCRHIISNHQLGTIITLDPSAYHSTPTQGSLGDIDACTIDAAIVSINNTDWPVNLSLLPVCHAVAPGQSVSFEGRVSAGTGTVLRVFQHSGYMGNLFGQRVFTDCAGASGDSGSLLIDTNNVQGVGIYMGTVPDGSGGQEGISQQLSQAATYFGLTTFI